MAIRIAPLRPQDHTVLVEFARKGMHFGRYVPNVWLARLYARSFLYQELAQASIALGAYGEGDRFLGALLARLDDEAPLGLSWCQRLYQRVYGVAERLLATGTESAYDRANAEMLAAYRERHDVDGELLFLAADPDSGARGVGTALLDALRDRARGRNLYLYTDDACTWQFYERRGFSRIGVRTIDIPGTKGRATGVMECYLYAGTL